MDRPARQWLVNLTGRGGPHRTDNWGKTAHKLAQAARKYLEECLLGTVGTERTQQRLAFRGGLQERLHAAQVTTDSGLVLHPVCVCRACVRAN